MEKINSEIFISSLFAFGFPEVDPVLFTMLLRKFSIDNQAKQQFIYEDKSFNPEFFQYVDFSTGKFRLKNNLTINSQVDQYLERVSLRKILKVNENLVKYFSQINWPTFLAELKKETAIIIKNDYAQNNPKPQTVVEYYVLCNKLKKLIRKGWQDWHVSSKRLESVAEHIFGTQQLAIAMWSQYEYDLDLKKVVMMLAVHELEEIIIQDLTMWDITLAEKRKQGHQAVTKILKNLLAKDQIQALVLEFDDRQTKEAQFAYWCDKLECDLQSKIYDEEGLVDLSNQIGNKRLEDEMVKKMLQEGKTWSEMWLHFSRERYDYDQNFLEVSHYAEQNNITRFLKKYENN